MNFFKKILIFILGSALVVGGVTLYVLWENQYFIRSENRLFIVENNIPIDPYLVPREVKAETKEEMISKISKIDNEEENKSEKTPLIKLAEEKNQEKNLSPPPPIASPLPAIPQDLQPKYTSENLFETKNLDSEEQNQREQQKIINQINSQRLKSSIHFERESVLKQETMKTIDYGINKINGESQIKATNENKLFRTLISMDKIPVIITQKVVSTLAGGIVGQVRDNVYSYMGRQVLIPKGSKIEGEYLNNNRVGEDRIQIVWTRIITPQGINIRLISKTQDLQGASGAIGKVDNKYWERYGMALTINTLTNAGLLGLSNLTQKVPNNYQTQEILNQGANDVSNISKAIMQEQIRINPTITLKAGSIVFISPKTDIWFPEPKDGEVMVQYFDRLKINKKEEEK